MKVKETSRHVIFESGNVIINLLIDYDRCIFDLSSPHQDTLVSIKGNDLSVITDTIKCLEKITEYLIANTDLTLEIEKDGQ